ncbi:hypothetical protein J8V57_10615 [Xenorhabdus sp. PB61.4]|uniref:hypothetical protein n=1 Tax=Xenorhabdus sp. PB61.4 TaxID=2788940 RepID=UPI001E3BB02F|nr:hypothetical protein [Xenorhabdus sp. PB61.4]MCC8366734.1 hypothetical protein [Xenorhabdus sp. PB61.4]
MRVLMILLMNVVLVGCVTNAQECDPTKGDMSIIAKFNCNYSGTWDQRVAEKEKVLQHEKILNKEFKAAYEALEQERKTARATLESKRRTQAVLQKSLSNLVNQLKIKAAGKAQMEKQVADLEKRIRESQQRPAQSEMQKQMELQQLQNQLHELQDSLMAS